MAKRFGFGRKEKLKSRKQIEELFTEGKSFPVHPVRIIYRFLPAGSGTVAQVGVSVSKRYFKKAVDRNRIKRVLREAYRLQKEELVEVLKEKQLAGHIFFMYTDKSIQPFDLVFTAVKKGLDKLIKFAKANEATT